MKPNVFFRSFTFFIFLFFTHSILFAQTDSNAQKKSYFKVEVSYLSNAVYSGRKDSSIVSYITPKISYNNKAGFYTDATMSFLANSSEAGRIDEIAIEAGYDFSVKNVDAGFYGSKYFYSDKSYSVASELRADIGAYITYNTDWISFGGGADVLISTGADVTVNGNLSHDFSFGDNAHAWTITPTAGVNAGTQTFYRNYYKNRKFSFATPGSRGRGHGSGNSNSGITEVISFISKNNFTILDYEFSVPLKYDAIKWGLFVTPTFAVPVNPATYAIDGVIQTETLSTSFFVKLGAYVKF